MDTDTILAPFEERCQRLLELNQDQRFRIASIVGGVEEAVGIEHLVDCIADNSSIGGDGTYYSVKDAITEDIIVPFGTGSLVSCDSTGNYFNLWMNGLQPERFYEFSFKVVSGSNTTGETIQYFEDGFTFKIER